MVWVSGWEGEGPEHEGLGRVSWAGRARVGSGRSLAGWQGKRALAASAPEVPGKGRMNGHRMGGSESCPALGARDRAWEGESKTLPSPLPLSFCILSRVSLRAVAILI